MGRKKKDDERYVITLKGLIESVLRDGVVAQDVVDAIELYLRRNHSDDGYPAIILEGKSFHFTTVEKVDD